MAEIERMRMELKYCECCGGLLLRPAGTGAVYCKPCRVRMEKLAPPRPQKAMARTTNERASAPAEPATSDALGEIQAVAAPAGGTEQAELWGWA